MSIHENDPLLKNSAEERAYNVKNLDEEYLVSSNSSATTIDEHDAEYLVKNRLGEVSLAMVTFW